MLHRYALAVPLFGAPRMVRRPPLRPSPLRRFARGAAFAAAVCAACLAILALGALLDA